MGITTALSNIGIGDFGSTKTVACTAAAVCLGAVACCYALCPKSNIPTFAEQEAKKAEFRDYVANMRLDHTIYRTKRQAKAANRQVEEIRAQIIEDLEAVYDHAINDGTFPYRCNGSDVYVALPKEYLSDRYGVRIEDTVYMLAYYRRLLPLRVTVGPQQGIPGIDPRGHLVSDITVGNTFFRQSWLEAMNVPGRIDVSVTYVCSEWLTLVQDAKGAYRLADLNVSRIGTSEEYDSYVLTKVACGDFENVHLTRAQDPENPISWLPREIGSCRVHFTEHPLNVDAVEPFVYGPQRLVDATHYFRPLYREFFLDYLTVRSLHFPQGLVNYLQAATPETWCETGDLINRYRWMGTQRGSALELGDAVYQLGSLVAGV